MNFQTLIVLLLPIRFRITFWKEFLEWLSTPIKQLQQQHVQAKASIFLRAKQNSQQGPLGKILTDLLGVTVVISTRDNSNVAITIYKEEEGREAPFIFLEEETDEEPLYVDLESDQTDRIDFDVNVSSVSDSGFTDLIKTVVNRVKLAGKKYQINYTDISIVP